LHYLLASRRAVTNLKEEPQSLKGRDSALPRCHPEPFAVILSPSPVILSEAKDLALLLRINFAKNLALRLRVNCAKDLALSIFKAMRDSSSPLLLRMTALSS
jgi:hypothetical protein